jgi:hypothetical protein
MNLHTPFHAFFVPTNNKKTFVYCTNVCEDSLRNTRFTAVQLSDKSTYLYFMIDTVTLVVFPANFIYVNVRLLSLLL